MSWSPAMASLRCAVRTTAAALARGGASHSSRVATIGAMEPSLVQTLNEASTHNLAALTTATAPTRRLFSSNSGAPLSSSPSSSSASAPSAPSDASSGSAPPNFDPDLWKGIIPDLSGLVTEVRFSCFIIVESDVARLVHLFRAFVNLATLFFGSLKRFLCVHVF